MRWTLGRGTLLTCALLVPVLAACPDRDDDAAPVPAADVATQTQPATGTAPSELASTADSYFQSWNGNDAAAVAGFFTDDAIAMIGDNTYTGRSEIQQQWLAPNVQAVSELRSIDDRMEQQGNYWLQSGSYRLMATEAAGQMEEETGTFRITWTRTPAGEWRILEHEVRGGVAPSTN